MNTFDWNTLTLTSNYFSTTESYVTEGTSVHKNCYIVRIYNQMCYVLVYIKKNNKPKIYHNFRVKIPF